MTRQIYPAAAALLLAACAALADYTSGTVSSVSAKQRYPWNGLVDISFTLSGPDGGYNLAFAATNSATGDEIPVRAVRDSGGAAVDASTEFAPGAVSLVWDAGADAPETVIDALALYIVTAPPGVQLWEGGPYWAETNIGAEEPWEYGLYFWWGDTVGYRRVGDAWVASDGSLSSFSFSEENTPTYNKSTSTLQDEGWMRGGDVLAPEHDAAQAHWGGSWRMPTMNEINALVYNCDWIWTTQNGVNGYVVRGRDDYSEASIFLPAAGNGLGTSLDYAGSDGAYWSSLPSSDSYGDDGSWGLLSASYGYGPLWDFRYTGLPVRPVQWVAAALSCASAGTATLRIDTRTEARIAAATEELAYSTAWNSGATGAAITLDGEPLFSTNAPASGDYAWDTSSVAAGLHTLVYDDGVETLTASFTAGKCSLTVICPHGGCDPSVGTVEFPWGTVVSATAPEYFVDGVERHACTGWTGGGSVPVSGATNVVNFAIDEDSTLEWLAGPAEYWLELGVEGQGSVNLDSGWFPQGTMKVVTATPAQYWRFVRWEGDTDGCRLTGATLRAPMTQGRSVKAVFARETCSLTVDNAFGVASQANGTSAFDKGTSVSAWSAGRVEADGVRLDCTGWAGTGSVPASGAGTNTVFALLEDSSLSWQWRTNYLVRVTVAGDGSVDCGEFWLEAGSNATVTAIAGETAYASVTWSGDTGGAAIDGLSITIPGDRPRDIVVTFEALGLGDALQQRARVWTNEGDMTWFPVTEGAHDGRDAAMASAAGIMDYAEGVLRAAFEGPGSLSFWWRLDVAGESAGIDLLVDGVYSDDVWLVGGADWTNAVVALGEGTHTVEWIFWSDGSDPTATAWLDQVFLSAEGAPAETQTTPVAVPFDWLEDYSLGDGTAAGYEAAATATAANGRNSVWECYVLGLDPTNAASLFMATIAIGQDGTPAIGFEPPRPGHTPAAWYRVEGRRELGSGDWGDVTGESRFFRVVVDVPGE